MPIKLPPSSPAALNPLLIFRPCRTFPSNSSHFLLFLLLIFTLPPSNWARLCYSCSGQCIQGAPCNCQMGSCEADFCFTEKRPSEIPGVFRLSKGCVKRPSRTRAGCDFDHFADHILCICNGPGDFCNDHILMRVNTASWRNVTCRMCPDGRPDCGQTCQGQWCHQKTSTGASGCGFGPPSLPYLYQTHEMLRQMPRVCLTMSRGTAGSLPHKFCVCTGHFCNQPIDELTGGNGPNQRGTTLFASIIRSLGGGGSNPQQQQQQRSIGRQWEMAALARAQQQPLFDCVSCDLSSEDAALTSNCRQNRCKGQFCVYAAQRVFNGPNAISGGSSPQWSNGRAQNGGGGVVQGNGKGGGIGNAVMHEKQGCINVTEPAFVQLGCTHKWVQNELEEIYCACRGPLCNADLSKASASFAISTNIHSTLFYLILIFISLFYTKCLSLSFLAQFFKCHF